MERFIFDKGIFKGCELTYEEEGHIYTLNGEKIESVTTLVGKFNPDKYKYVDADVLDNAAFNGNVIHTSIELYAKYGITSDKYLEFRNFLRLKELYKFEILECEIPILVKVNNKVYAGRFDDLIKIGDKLYLNDNKTTSILDTVSGSLQLSLYALGYKQTYDKTVDGLTLTWLRDRKYALVPVSWWNEEQLNEKVRNLK